MVLRTAIVFQLMNERVAALEPARRRLSPAVTPIKVLLLAGLGLFGFLHNCFALGQFQYVENVASPGSCPIVQQGVVATIYSDANDLAGVKRAAADLQADMARVTGLTPAITHNENKLGNTAIIIGTLGKSRIIDRLIRDRKLMSRPSRANGNRFSSRSCRNRCPALRARWSLRAATSAGRSTASTICPNRSACRRGIGGRM